MKWVIALGLLASLAANAATYPVDEAIASLRDKAKKLELYREFLENNKCWVQVDSNKVNLSPGALRIGGLFMGISNAVPGNYVAWDSLPKPQLFRGMVAFGFENNEAAKDAVLVRGEPIYTADGSKMTGFAVGFGEPQEIPGSDGMHNYNTKYGRQDWTDQPGTFSRKSTMITGRAISFGCN